MASHSTLILPNLQTSEVPDVQVRGLRRFCYFLLLGIAICSPWGDLLRLSVADDTESVQRGITTLMAVTVIAFSAVSLRMVRTIANRPRWLFYFAFLSIAVIASLLQQMPLRQLVSVGAVSIGYCLLAVSVSSFCLDLQKGRTFIRLFAISSAAMCLVAVADEYDLINVPGFNEGYRSFALDRSLRGTSLTGPFADRTALGAHLALAFPAALMEMVYGKSKSFVSIIFWIGIFGAIGLAVMVSYSRGLYVMEAIVVAYAVYCTRGWKIARLFLLAVPVFIVFFLLVAYFFPDEIRVFKYRLESISLDNISNAGRLRVYAFQQSLQDILRNPFGMGFTLIEYKGKMYRTHSIITDYIRPAGVIGAACVFFFSWPVLRVILRRKKVPEMIIFCSVLVGFLVYGLSHSTLNTLAIWIVIGWIYPYTFKHARAECTI